MFTDVNFDNSKKNNIQESFSDYSIVVGDYIRKLKELYEQDRNSSYSKKLYDEINNTELLIPGFVIPFKSYTTLEDYKEKEEELLQKIVIMSRKLLLLTRGVDSSNSSLFLMCKIMTSIIKDICDSAGIKNYEINFISYTRDHRALLLKMPSGNNYLVDLTYQQFFLNRHNLEERHVRKHWLIEGPYIGYHMKKDDQLLTARNIIEKGFISSDDPGFKPYMDGFISAFYSQPSKDYYLNLSGNEYIDIIRSEKRIDEK